MSDRAYPKRWHPHYYHLRSITSIIENIAMNYLSKMSQPVLIDMGCGIKPYRPILDPFTYKYIGLDFSNNQNADVHILHDGKAPLPDNYADIILSTQVLEHVESPMIYLSECYRLLKRGGFIILSTHGYWSYHPMPCDYWRWTGPGLIKSIEDARFKVIDHHGIMSLIPSAFQLLQLGLESKINKIGPLSPIFYLLMQSLIQILDKLFTGNKKVDACTFVVLAQK